MFAGAGADRHFPRSGMGPSVLAGEGARGEQQGGEPESRLQTRHEDRHRPPAREVAGLLFDLDLTFGLSHTTNGGG